MMFQGTVAFLAAALAYGQARNLHDYQENCDFPLPDPGCVCYKFIGDGVLQCQDLHLTSWPDFAQIGNKSVDTLDLSGNSFTQIPKDAFGELRMRRLFLTNNTPQLMFHHETFNEHQKSSLEHLDISYSMQFTETPSAVKQLHNLRILAMIGDYFTVRQDAFHGLDKLTDLRIGRVFDLEPGAMDLPHLKRIQMAAHSNGPLTRFFGLETLLSLQGLESIILDNSDGYLGWHIYGEYQPFFYYFPNLVSFEMVSSKIASEDELLESGTFQNLMNLLVFNIHDNYVGMPATFLSYLTGVEVLILSKNQIYNIKNTDLLHNLNLQMLDLKDNSISVIEAGTFSHLNHLHSLDLTDNDLVTMDVNAFPPQFESMSINLAGNKFRCTCEMWWLVELTHEQMEGAPGPLDLFEVANDITCYASWHPLSSLMYTKYDELVDECD